MNDKAILYKAQERGFYQSNHYSMFYTFAFEKYRLTKNKHFGVLNTFNEVELLGGERTQATLQSNVEILVLVLEGEIKYHDSLTNHELLQFGDIQVISTGNNLSYSFSNASNRQKARFLEIRVYANEINTKPKYFKSSFNFNLFNNMLQPLLMPRVKGFLEYLPVNQCVWLNVGNFTKGQSIFYPAQKEKNGIYVFVLVGSIKINNYELTAKDGIGIWETQDIKITIEEDAKIIILDIASLYSFDFN